MAPQQEIYDQSKYVVKLMQFYWFDSQMYAILSKTFSTLTLNKITINIYCTFDIRLELANGQAVRSLTDVPTARV